jgi:uncharacterized damage-inducible protein DinB
VTRSVLSDAFDHHVWATVRVLDVCTSLTEEEVATAVPGTYGSILDTLRHLVGSDSWYLFVISGERTPRIDEDTMSQPELRSAVLQDGTAWSALLQAGFDPQAVVIVHRPEGVDSHAPLGIRYAQVLHHGTDHRSQICTALTALGIEPPLIDVWDFGEVDGRVFDTDPA